MYKTRNTTEIVLHLAGLTNQFLNGTHAGVLRTGSDQKGPTRGSEPYSSPAPLGQSTRIGKKMYARAKGLRIKNWPEPVLFGRPERTNGMRPKINPNPSPNPNDLEQLQASKEAERTKIRVA